MEDSNSERTLVDIDREYQALSDEEVSITRHLITMNIKPDLEDTFKYMMLRKFIRSKNGLVKRQTWAQYLWTVLLVFMMLASIGSIITQLKVPDSRNIFSMISYVSFLLALSYLIYKVADVIKWCLYWLAICTVMLLFTVDLQHFPHQGNPKMALVIFFVFIALESLTIITYLYNSIIFPWILREAKWFSASYWWKIKRDFYDPNKFSYLTLSWQTLLRRHSFSYYGSIHPISGKPHGYGKWTDDSRSGELLEGYFNDGIPVGPFQSREFGSGYIFRNLRIGIVLTCADEWDRNSFFPAWRIPEFTYGVAGVECSTSGKFFAELPHASLIESFQTQDGSASPSGILRMAELLSANENENLQKNFHDIIKIDPIALHIEGYSPKLNCDSNKITLNIDRMKGSFEIDGWEPIKDRCREALIYFHGFNCDVKTATERHAQLVALGNFPSHIDSFIFGWPCAKVVTFPVSVKYSESNEILRRFELFIRDIIYSDQYSSIHLMGHSIGARVLLHMVHAFDSIFVKLNSENSREKIGLSSIILTNAEADLQKFIQIQYPIMRQYCEMITVYVDESDGALFPDELLTRTRMLGLHGIGSSIKTYHENHRGNHDDIEWNDVELEPSERKTISWMLKLNRPLLTEHFEFDVDYIDCTLLDANVHDLRHNYYNLNKSVVDDIHDILVYKKRAIHRKRRLVRIQSNLFTFLSAPSYIVNP